MNYPLICQVLGRVIGIIGALMLIPAIVAVGYGESVYPFVVSITVAFIAAALMIRVQPKSREMYAKEGYVTVALAWILMSAVGALPFVVSGAISSFVDAYFETVSGFTTTGATILSDVEAMPMGLQFWRCFTIWIGGMGVLVFMMFVLPLNEEHSLHIFRAEMPGPIIGKLVPKARDTAMILYGVYAALTLILVVLYLFGGMSLYDALIHAFSTAGTGGFSNHANSYAYFDSAYIDYVTAIFLLLFGTNFNLYFLIFMGKFKDVINNEEFKWYLFIVFAAAIVIACFISDKYGGVVQAFRYSFFTVASVITTAGHVTANYDLWPTITVCILFFLMFCGASAGGTNGGIKVSRLLVAVKVLRNDLIKQVRPREVHTVKLNGEVVSKSTQHTIVVFIVMYILILCAAVAVVALDNFDFTSTFSAVLTCIGNVGPGSGICGPVGNYVPYSALSKLVLTLCMLIGRLEIIPIMILFTPSTWKKKF